MAGTANVHERQRANKYHADYAEAFEGAYLAKPLERARQQGRIGHAAVDPILPLKL
jgi:hypothetical protein